MNFGYHFARTQAAVTRRAYRAALPAIVFKHVDPPRSLPFEVFAYSSERDMPEQVASIRSFLKHAGRPKRFTVVSDGSHSGKSIFLLKKLDASVHVQLSTRPPREYSSETFFRYLTIHPTGKQLALIMSLPQEGPALYVDSDVLFFAGAGDLENLAGRKDADAYYLADCQLSGDPRVFCNAEEQQQPVNTGVLFLFRPLDWSLAVERFLKLDGAPDFFTNQSLTHLAMHANGARPLDPGKYVLQLDDQFVYKDRHASSALALRHYVNPVRHKFWTSLHK